MLCFVRTWEAKHLKNSSQSAVKPFWIFWDSDPIMEIIGHCIIYSKGNFSWGLFKYSDDSDGSLFNEGLICGHRSSPDDSSTNAGLISGCPLSFSRGCHGSSSVHTRADVHCRALPAKFLCQRKSALTHLWQTRSDSVHSRPNRAPIQLRATGSPFLTQSHLTVHPLTQAQEGWRLSSLKEHFPSTCLSQPGCELLLHQD